MDFIWESGKTISSTERANFILKTVRIMKEPSVRVMRVEKADIFIIMDAFMREE